MSGERKLREIMAKRDRMINEFCNHNSSSWEELSNLPGVKNWYVENILPLDDEIVLLANVIIESHNLKCERQKTVRDVYSNNELLDFIEDEYIR